MHTKKCEVILRNNKETFINYTKDSLAAYFYL